MALPDERVAVIVIAAPLESGGVVVCGAYDDGDIESFASFFMGAR
jgi:hypothetical protein